MMMIKNKLNQLVKLNSTKEMKTINRLINNIRDAIKHEVSKYRQKNNSALICNVGQARISDLIKLAYITFDGERKKVFSDTQKK